MNEDLGKRVLPYWFKDVIWVIGIIIIGFLMFKRGAVWQCNEIGMKSYVSDNLIGFECDEERKPYYPKTDTNFSISFENKKYNFKEDGFDYEFIKNLSKNITIKMDFMNSSFCALYIPNVFIILNLNRSNCYSYFYSLLHELKHHYCYLNKYYWNNTNQSHQGCFLDTPIDKKFGYIE